MTLNFGGGLFPQRDVRETPASTATATSVGLTDGKYIVQDFHADMTDERKITEGEGIDFVDNGANGTFVISGETATSANKGIAKFDVTDFTVTAGDVTLKVERIQDIAGPLVATGGTKTGIAVTYQDATGDMDFVVDHDAANNFLATEHRAWENSIAQNIHADNYTDTGDTTYTAGEGLDLAGTVFSGENATTANKGIASFNTNDFTVSSGAVSLKNKTTYVNIPPAAFQGQSDLTGYTLQQGIIQNTNGNNQSFYACVQIPNGAVVTGAVVYGDDTSVTWTLSRITSAGSFSGLATTTINTEDTSISNATVDNSTYSYVFYVSNLPNTKIIYGARIKYTTDYD